MSFASFRGLFLVTGIYIVLWLLAGIAKLCRKESFQWQRTFLLIASCFFLGISDWRFFICLLALTVVAFFIAAQMEKRRSVGKSYKWLLQIGVGLSLGMLGVFKYFNFFAASFCKLLGTEKVVLHLMLPIGISFYTFSAIGYLMDVYRGKQKACVRFGEWALYMSFFPKLVAGPIVRAGTFMEQLQENRGVTIQRFKTGIQIFVFGMFKKVVLADHLSVFVDDVFGAPIAFDSLTCILAAVSYSLQIYFDFSGYSDMAIGIAKMCGYDFESNFNLPYISENLTEFWKRWHISLSSWLQEYVYYSLGGNRKGKYRTYVNLLLTMMLGGLWHGADWTFVVWGTLHGLLLILHKLFLQWKKKQFGDAHATCTLWSVVSATLTFIAVTVCWIFFRADSISAGVQLLRGMIVAQKGIRQMYSWSFFSIAILLVATIAAAVKSRRSSVNRVDGWYPVLNLDKFWSQVLFFVMCGLTIGMGYFGNTVFIYGKF